MHRREPPLICASTTSRETKTAGCMLPKCQMSVCTQIQPRLCQNVKDFINDLPSMVMLYADHLGLRLLEKILAYSYV